VGLELWGGWDSNPRPTDYESSPPATLVIMAAELVNTFMRDRAQDDLGAYLA